MSNEAMPSTYWQSLAVAADEGHLFLNAEAASSCHAACSEYLQQLEDRQYEAEQLADISGWGDFNSGQQIRQIYADKAVGGNNNMVKVLQSHIDVVTEMQAVFSKFFAETNDTEHQNAGDIEKYCPGSRLTSLLP